MTGDGGRWPRRGRRRRDRDDYADEDDYGGHPGHNGRSVAYPDADSYGQHAGYGPDDREGWPGGYGQTGGYHPGYGDPNGYRDSSGYRDPEGYGDPNGYGGRDGYGGQAGYGEPGGYGPEAGYGGPSGYPQPGGYADDGGYGEPGYTESGFDRTGYGDADDHGTGTGNRGRHSGGSAAGLPGPASREPDDNSGYAPDVDTNPYGSDSYGSADRYGQGTPGSYGSGSESGQWQGPYGAADPLPPAGYDTGSPYTAGPALGYDTGSFGRPDTGSQAGWAFTPGASGYDSDPLDQGPEAIPGSPASGFGPDSGSFGRPPAGSFGRADSGTFGRPDMGSFDEDEDYGDHDRGPASPALRALPAAPGSYAGWRDDPVEDDWEDDRDGELLSHRFARGDGRERGSDGGGRARGRRPRRIRGKAAFTVAILTVALVIGIAAAFGYKYVNTWITHRYGNYKTAGTGTVEITVKSGDTLAGLGPLLLTKGVIMALRPYDSAAAAASGTLQPGIYRLHHHMNSTIAVKYLLNPKYRTDIKVTIIEGKRATEIAALLAAKTGRKESEFLQLINHPPASLGLPSWSKGKRAEGFLFPDTYSFLPGETPLQILRAMVSDFKTKAGNIAAEAASVHTTPWHALIVASMAQAESGPADFGKVARVAWNRLVQGMALHFDSTVFYGLGISNNPTGAATSAQIKKDTPYNTYIHAGLPPGPIGNPGVKAITAALHPPHGSWLYFITDERAKPPKTYFTASYAQFQQWQKQFQG
jgi:peptidoglycan lytic transglycosylase G